MTDTREAPTIRAPRGRDLTCKGWHQEAALRMLMNNLDPEVAERPEDLVVYGGTGKAARDWESFWAIVSTLQGLDDDETLLVQSGKPVAVFRTHPWAPRVLIANSLLVPEWADWETFRELERAGLTMYGQMTAGSWIYIGTQGILQGTYETFAAVAEQRFGGTLRGRVCLTAGLGGMGGAQPLAITMNQGVALCVEVDPDRIDRRISHRYLDERIDDLDEAVERAEEAKKAGEPLSIGILGNAAEVFPALLERGYVPDAVTDQTSAHDPLVGYVPAGYDLDAAAELREADPDRYIAEARASMARHCAAMVGFKERGRRGLRLRQLVARGGETRRLRWRLRLSRFRAGVHQAALLRGQGAVPVGRALGRGVGHSGNRRCDPRSLPRRRASGALDLRSKGEGPLPGPPRAHLLARGRRAAQGWTSLQRARRRRDHLGAHRDRAGPPGHRQRRLAIPRDRGDEGRLRRHRRLAHPERDVERRRRG